MRIENIMILVIPIFILTIVNLGAIQINHNSVNDNNEFASNNEMIAKMRIVDSILLEHPNVHNYVFEMSQDSMKYMDKVYVHDMVTYIFATDEQSEIVQSLINKFGDKDLASIIYKLTEQKFDVSERCLLC